MDYKTLAEGWEDFRNTVIPATAGPIQLKEMKNAFYAGARVCASIAIEQISDGKPEVLIELDGELRAYIDGVMARMKK